MEGVGVTSCMRFVVNIRLQKPDKPVATWPCSGETQGKADRPAQLLPLAGGGPPVARWAHARCCAELRRHHWYVYWVEFSRMAGSILKVAMIVFKTLILSRFRAASLRCLVAGPIKFCTNCKKGVRGSCMHRRCLCAVEQA